MDNIELRAKIESLRLKEPTNEEREEAQEEAWLNGNSSDTFEDGEKYGRIYGGNSMLNKVLALLS